MSEKPTLPAQIENLINKMFEKTSPYSVRANYRQSLDLIAVEINKAINKFDTESYKK